MSPLHTVSDRFLSALRFLTILRLPGGVETGFGAAVFPVAGLVIGLALVCADWFFAFLPFELRNLALVVFLAVLTGGIHHDGLADTLDALGGREREDRLRIMSDGPIGTFAVLGLVLGVATKVSSLMLLGEPGRFPALLLAPMLARMAMVLCAYRAHPAKPDGLGAEFVRAVEPGDFAVAAAITVLAAAALAGGIGVMACFVVVGLTLGVRAFADRRFGGITGDVLGASGEVVETVLFAFFATARIGV